MKSTALLKLVSAEIPFRGLRAFLVTFSALSTTPADLKAYDLTPDFRWTARVSPGSIGPGTNTVSFAVDSCGNSYVVTPLSGALTNGTNILINRGSLDILLTKYDRTGRLIWSNRSGGEGFATYYGMTLDQAGNCYLCGLCNGSKNADFGQITLTNTDTSYLFVAKFDPNGRAIWVDTAGENSGPLPEGIGTDRSGNCYVTGELFGQTKKFGSVTLTNAQQDSAFIAKYASLGNLLWVKTPASSRSSGKRVVVDDGGTVYWLGDYSGTLHLASFVIPAKTSPDRFWAQLDGSGNVISGTRIGASGSFASRINTSVTLDRSGHAYFTGTFDSSISSTNIDFGGLRLTPRGVTDAFVAKCDTNGRALWVRTIGGAGFDYGGDIAVDGDGICYGVWSSASNDCDFGGATLGSGGNYDIFVAKFDSTGNLIWVKQAGGTQFDVGLGIGLDSADNCYVMGAFSGTSSFGRLELTTSDSPSFFLARINRPSPVLSLATVGPELLILWPTNKTGFVLEGTKALWESATWSPVTVPSGIVGDQQAVIIHSSVEASGFYRLRESE